MTDVVVVGGGVTGTSIAYHLARDGASVVLVDKAGIAEAPAATWASAGGLRSQGRHAPDRPLTLEAAARWPTLPDELDADLEVRLGGHLHVAETDREIAALEERVAADRAGGIAIELVSGDALRQLAPGLTPRALAGAYTAGDGQAHPARTARAFARAARRLGATIRTGSAATPVVAADRVQGVEVDGTRLPAGTVVLATGAWSVGGLAALGLALPLRWRGLQMLLSEVAAPALAPTVTAVGRNLSLKQSPTGQYMIGGRWFGRPAGEGPAAVPIDAHVARQWSSAAAILPALAGLRLAQSWAGVEAQTPDAMPYLGPAGPSGLYLALGFSNHGFQISPAVGLHVARDILAGPDPLLAPFAPDRSAGADPAATRAFLDEGILL